MIALMIFCFIAGFACLVLGTGRSRQQPTRLAAEELGDRITPSLMAVPGTIPGADPGITTETVRLFGNYDGVSDILPPLAATVAGPGGNELVITQPGNLNLNTPAVVLSQSFAIDPAFEGGCHIAVIPSTPTDGVVRGIARPSDYLVLTPMVGGGDRVQILQFNLNNDRSITITQNISLGLSTPEYPFRYGLSKATFANADPFGPSNGPDDVVLTSDKPTGGPTRVLTLNVQTGQVLHSFFVYPDAAAANTDYQPSVESNNVTVTNAADGTKISVIAWNTGPVVHDLATGLDHQPTELISYDANANDGLGDFGSVIAPIPVD